MVTREPGLSPAELDAWIGFVAVLETLPGAIDAQLKRAAGVNLFEYTVLAMLSEEPGRTLPMSSLAELSFGSLSRLSHAVARLEKRGWVEKHTHTGRAPNTVSLTDVGFDALVAAAGPHRSHVRRLVVDALTDDELVALARISRKLVGAAEPDVLERLRAQVPRIIERNTGDVPTAE